MSSSSILRASDTSASRDDYFLKMYRPCFEELLVHLYFVMYICFTIFFIFLWCLEKDFKF